MNKIVIGSTMKGLFVGFGLLALAPVAVGHAAVCDVHVQAFDVQANMRIKAGSAQQALEVLVPIPGVQAVAVCDGVEYSVRGTQVKATGKIHEDRKHHKKSWPNGDYPGSDIDINGNYIR